MNNRELQLKFISLEFAKWQIQIENLNSLNLYDSNIFSEHTLCELLNNIFDYNLKSTNLISANFPAVDLIDDENRIAIQVTSSKHKQKIQSTLDKFLKNNFESKYDKLYIIILGSKQKRYSNLKSSIDFPFVESEQILDFKSLLSIITRLPIKRIEKISSLLTSENVKISNHPRSQNITLIKKKLALKKRLQKDLLLDLDRKYWEQMRYEPWIKFVYHNAIIRSVDDKSWPNADEKTKGKISSWFKGEFWNFYENGIELISHGGEAIFDADGFWDILNWKGDKREENENYKKVSYHLFLRIPYEHIVDYDMQPDAYDGIPTIYVEYAKDDMPYEEILYGTGGYYNKEDPKNSYYNYYFEKSKRKKLK